jgi:hypothetical protein
MANLSSRKALDAATTEIRIAARLEHSMKQALEDAETYDWYPTKPNHSFTGDRIAESRLNGAKTTIT